MKDGVKDEILSTKLKLENNYEKAQAAVRERLKFTLELATDAEAQWNRATPPDRVVLLKNVLSNLCEIFLEVVDEHQPATAS